MVLALRDSICYWQRKLFYLTTFLPLAKCQDVDPKRSRTVIYVSLKSSTSHLCMESTRLELDCDIEEHVGCFNGIAKLVIQRHGGKGDAALAEFAKLVNSTKYRELESLYYSHIKQRQGQGHGHGTKFADVLQRILQVQEVQTMQEYRVNGKVIKVHVIEDTDL